MRLVDRFFIFALAALAGLEIVSLLAFEKPVVSTVLLLGISLAVVISTLRDPVWGVYAVLAELFVGGKGYLLAAPAGGAMLSLRMAVFVAVFSTWLAAASVRAFKNGFAGQKFSGTYAALALLWSLLAVGIVSGLARYPFNQVFFDGNGWLFLLLLPAVRDAIRSSLPVKGITQLLIAATFVIGFKTALLLFLFGHVDLGRLTFVYRWIRDTGVGEITPVAGTLFRIFFQSHLYLMVSWLVLLSLLMQRSLRRRADIIVAGIGTYVAGLTLLVSQSRSLWIGAAAGFVALIAYSLRRNRLSLGRIALVALLVGYVTWTQVSAVTLISGNAGTNVFTNRFSSIDREPAASSRKNQLRPLTDAIMQRPLLGWGFGKTLRYQSQDPRVVRGNPDGRYTTTAFEWGYLDIALKIGLVGLAAYLIWLLALVRQGISAGAGTTAITIGLVAIAVTNIFSPYLNHPLGIGWVLFTAAAVNQTKTALPKPAAGK